MLRIVSLFALTTGAAMALPSGLEILKHPAESRRLEAEQGATVCPSLCLARFDFGNRQDYYFVDAEGATRYLLSERRPENADVRVNPPILDYQPTVRASAATDCGGDGWGFRYGDTVVKLGLTGFSLDLRYVESGVGHLLLLDPDGQPIRTSPAATGDREGLKPACRDAREVSGDRPPEASGESDPVSSD